MFNKSKLPRNYFKALRNLELLNLTRGTWIDAGCGEGSYTIPLSLFVDKVIAIDTNKSNLERLDKFVSDNEITNVKTNYFDFRKKYSIFSERIDGILYSFSLHFHKEINNILDNSLEILNKNEGKIIIIEYERKIPVPWVPYPINESKLTELLHKAKFENISTIFKNNRYYILEAIKN